ncbi:MAG TPA: PQQ-dependent sugar dehydrogenase, partial [Humisphaera sp.]|nr:PQQ-dependent sugar dehydrogenase [Humisphaera sp.]
MKIILTLLIAATFTTLCRAQTQPTFTFDCRFTDKPITIDGKADEDAWKQAAVIDNFRAWWKKDDDPKSHAATKARMLWDRDYFYFFVEMEDRDLIDDNFEHQGRLWLKDVFEIFFRPADDKPAYYEFEVTPLNKTLELYFPSRNSGGYDKYKDLTHIKWETAVQLRGTVNKSDDRDEGWSVEGRIPWRDMAMTGGRPNVGEKWKFAFHRGDYSSANKTDDLMSCAPLTKQEFHRYEDYPTVQFVGPQTSAAPGSSTKRIAWTGSHVVGSPDGPLPYTVTRAFAKLKLFQPLYVSEEPGSDAFFLLQHLGSWSGPGRLLRFKNDPNVDSAQTLLDMDRLAYGMTLHPDFVHNGYLYIISNGPSSQPRPYKDRISRFTVDRKPPYGIDPKSEQIILEWDSNGHDGGDLAFGPDGYLYHASGDGSADSDANLRGQDITHLNSAMLRLDVDHPDAGKAYSIPKDNPFINTPGARPEIWAYGFRNPWRIAFDRFTGALWVGQNGQDLWEEVYLVHKGENYGWSVYEGSHPFNLNRARGPTGIVFPVVEHPHSEMRSISGGVVYYGSKLPQLRGAYIYGDWSTGRIWGVKHDGKQVTWHQELARTTLQIVGFRETAAGDLLVVDQGGGLYYLTPAPTDAPHPSFPTKLSETGLFRSTKDNIPDPALIAYDVNAPLWSDGAAKERFIAVPNDGKLEMTPTHGWNCPEGTVLVKTFSLETQAGMPRRIETRLLTKQLGQWVGYSYLWNDDQTDATLVAAEGIDRDYSVRDATAQGGERTQRWHFPSRAECMTCHSRAANFVLGLSTLQLNRDHEYAGMRENQLSHLERLGMLSVDYGAHVRQWVLQQLRDSGKTFHEA